ncbi:T7SS effector LXG polymorphic toxin [Solibacillus sp. FSL W8-0372]|uniref:T7SS effector LXG polymorphic toxin n=1 Tax=Solibacillus sp. FSL W8-0372 TaxID=2921713 RepID=UPI0030D08C58
MKVLDVNEFQQGLERTVSQLTRLESEMKQIESAVQGLTQLEESLKGQGGEALRAYYESCHLPFLTFFNTFKNSFTSVLQEMKTALSSLEPDSSGFIRQAALEGEIEQGLNRAKQVTEELTDEANNIMDQVSDIVNLPKLDDSEVHLGVHDAKRHRDETVEKLIEFDVSQTDALTTIQTDLMHMKTWITNIETMMTEGVTDVNFPAEQWQSFASQNPLMIALAYRTQSLDQVINMNPLFNPGGIGGANPYTLSGLYLTGQQPLGTFGLSGAMVSTNFVSFMKQKEKEIAKELSATATTVDDVKDEGNGFLNFLGDVGSGATKVGKGLLDFLILDDVNTLTDKNASGLDKGIALASFIPVGKVLKIPKAIDKIVDSNVDEVVGKGTSKAKNFEFRSKVYSPVEYQGRRVYQRNDIDWNMVDPDKGLTNLERAQMGWAPLGKDGKAINLHHILQQEPGPMLEIHQTVHQKNYRILHGLLEKNKFKRVKPIDKIASHANKSIDEISEIRRERKMRKKRSFRSDPDLDQKYNDFRGEYWKWRSDELLKDPNK